MKESAELYNEIIKVESVGEKNKLAIQNGYMIPDGTSERNDLSEKLGKNLSTSDLKCYLIIYEGTRELVSGGRPGGFVPSMEIYNKLSHINKSIVSKKSHEDNVSELVLRLTKKLGKSAVITKNGPGGGYKSRRALIELKVEENMNNKKSESLP